MLHCSYGAAVYPTIGHSLLTFMAKPEENANEDRVEEEDLDEEDQSDEDESDDQDDEDDSEGDEDDESDSDEDDDKPITRKELKEILGKRSKNRSAAARRASGKRNLSDKQRQGKSDPSVDSLREDVQSMKQAEAKRQFGYEHNLSPKEVDLVFRFDRKPSAKTLKDPAVKGALEGIRAAQRAKDGIPRSNGRTFQVGGKDYSELKPEEKSKHFTDRRRAILEGKRDRR